MEIKLTPEKVTKNTIRFKEVLRSELDTPVIGTLYVQKATLKQLNYDGIKDLIVTIKIEGGAK